MTHPGPFLSLGTGCPAPSCTLICVFLDSPYPQSPQGVALCHSACRSSALLLAPLTVLLAIVLAGCGALSSSGGGGGGGTQVPAMPTGLQATAGNAQVSLSWNTSTGATSYNVKRSNTSGGPYTKISSPTTASYTDTGLTNGTPYYYVVTAVNSAGESAASSQATATPTAPVTIPPRPTDLQATAGNAQVSLTWSASTGATSYNVKRSTTSGGPYTKISSPDGDELPDTGLTNGTPYYYVVTAVNSAGESARSSQATATPTAPITIPATPTDLQATAGNAQVSLTWNASTGATSYNVKRSTTSGGPYTKISSPETTSYTRHGPHQRHVLLLRRHRRKFRWRK